MDKNFVFPLRVLENERVRLTPFEAEHLETLQKAFLPHPELFNFMSVGPFNTLTDFKDWYWGSVHPDSTSGFFYVEARSNQNDNWDTAGMISLINSSMAHLKTEIGYVTIIPKWQRTFVTGNAAGLFT